MRRMTSQIIEGSGEFTVAGTARNGYDALKQIHALDPDSSRSTSTCRSSMD